MQSWDSRERRKIPRYEMVLFASETELVSRKEIKLVTRDICENGVGVLLNERLPVSALVEVFWEMPDNLEKFCVRGKIIWVSGIALNQFRAGICLDEFCLKPIPMVLRIIKLHLKTRYSTQ